MNEALLERLKDELELDEKLTGEQVVAEARKSLHLPQSERDIASQVREICEELGIKSGEDSYSMRHERCSSAEEGVPPYNPVVANQRDITAGLRVGSSSRTSIAEVSGSTPPSYEDALNLLEDPRQLYGCMSASPERLSATLPVPWTQQLLTQLALRNEFQGKRLHRSFIGLFNAVAADEKSFRKRVRLSDDEIEKMRLANEELKERLRDLELHGASSAERDELQQKVSDLQAKLIATYEWRERAAEQKQQLDEAVTKLESSERTVEELTEQLRQQREEK